MSLRRCRICWGLALCLGGALLTASTGRATHKSAPVSPALEIDVLDPNVDPRGNPTVVAAAGGQIDIPPTVLVHKYYYTGDRTFQFKLIAGGPCIVVASHPKTGERLYIPVMMLPGAPRVTYTSKSIIYDFGNQYVTVHFCCLSGRATVQYGHAVVSAECKAKLTQMATSAKTWVERTGLPDASKKLMTSAKDAANTSADKIHDVGKAVATPVLQAVKLIPGINMLKGNPEDEAIHLRNLQVKGAEVDSLRKDVSIPTNR